MGFFEGVLPNVTSMLEGSRTLIFPAESSVQKEIPLYLKLTCVEYSMSTLARSGGYNPDGGTVNVGNVKAYIYVPVPSKLISQTAMRYKQEENEEFMKGQLQKDAEEGLKLLGGKASTWLTKYIPGAGRFAAYGQDAIRKLARTYSSLIDTDFTETILQSGSKRSFTVSLYLPCLNLDDSLAAAEIASAFESLALPTLMGVNVPILNAGVQFHFHPPMWFFGIGPLLGTNTDIDWTSQPQASVLTNVAVSRTAIDASSFTALDGNIKPVAYSITLNFQEIETAFRAIDADILTGSKGTSFTIKNRSGAAKSAGVTNLIDILPGI